MLPKMMSERVRVGVIGTGAISGALRQVARHGSAAVRQMQADVRASPVVHADETGWRQNGRNGYM